MKKISTASFQPTDLAHGQNIIFCATGISDSAILRCAGARRRQRQSPIRSHASEEQTVRFVRARHDLQIKTIRLRSDNREHIL